jgi:hypothetical protein
MSPKWIMFIVFCYVGFQLLGSIAEAAWFTNTLSVMNLVTGTYVVSSASSGDFFSFIAVAQAWLMAIVGMLTWDYSFLTGTWVLLRWLLTAFTVGFIWGIVQLVRGTSS